MGGNRTYKRIEEYGLLGNLETCALVGKDGSVDWCCFPHLSSPSVFAALLDAEKGGSFSIAPVDPFDSALSYLPATNVLQITFTTAGSRVSLIDFMPVKGTVGTNHRALFRRLSCTKGGAEVEINFAPSFNYAREAPRFSSRNGTVTAGGHGHALYLHSPLHLRCDAGRATARVKISEGQVIWFVMQYRECRDISPAECEQVMKKTLDFWKSWTGVTPEEWGNFETSWQELAMRSSLALKLLTHPTSGAIAAAPTTSLPEIPGGIRNWDYRYAWIRDAAFTVQALNDLGHTRAAADYFRWIRRLCSACADPSRLSVCYQLDGDPVPEEQNLDHLAGYRDSRPVRIGNEAVHQFQLDIYGELVNAVYETLSHQEHRPPRPTLGLITALVNDVCDKWTQPDAGIWEMRKPAMHHTYSKVMCWVAIDRGLRMAREWGFPVPEEKWKATAGQIRAAVLERGFSTKLNSFVQIFDSDHLDATSLLMPALGFLDGADPRVLGTIEAVISHLSEDGLVYRYRVDDGLPGRDAPFLICSFWLVTALILSGQLKRAEEFFERIARRAGPAGLFGEEIDPATGEHRGNFPQGFSHIGLINSCFYLSRARRGEGAGPRSIRGAGEREHKK